MAARTGTVLFSSGTAERVVLYQVGGVDTNDTMSVIEEFSKVKAAHAIGSGAASPSTDSPAISGTTLTFDAATQVDETLYVLVVGNIA